MLCLGPIPDSGPPRTSGSSTCLIQGSLTFTLPEVDLPDWGAVQNHVLNSALMEGASHPRAFTSEHPWQVAKRRGGQSGLTAGVNSDLKDPWTHSISYIIFKTTCS